MVMPMFFITLQRTFRHKSRPFQTAFIVEIETFASHMCDSSTTNFFLSPPQRPRHKTDKETKNQNPGVVEPQPFTTSPNSSASVESDRPELLEETNILWEKLSASEKENRMLTERLGCAEEKVAQMEKEIQTLQCGLSEKEQALKQQSSFLFNYSESLSSLTDKINEQAEENKRLEFELLKEKNNFFWEKNKLQKEISQMEERYKLELSEKDEALQRNNSFCDNYSESLAGLMEKIAEQNEENERLEKELLNEKIEFGFEKARWTKEMKELKAENIQQQVKK
ncbi:golgin subfamily A member 6-like protein 7 [Antennarius striatus]|uniref:golgin subfamily A member 6-like protein 7 n=1 Tax=Antennarius striatus TaxID=241820 RepID=UPI0035B2A4A4